jgi:hypothetical protein
VIDKPRALFVTGVSCAGKTHTGTALDKDQLAAGWWDLDEHAPDEAHPSTGWLDWLRWRAGEELLLLADQEPDDRRYVITGITWPFRVVEAPVWSQIRGRVHSVEWVMLDPPWSVLRERLNERLAHKPRREREELLRYNRGLRQPLRDQVEAYRGGYVCTATDADEVLGFVLGMVRS